MAETGWTGTGAEPPRAARAGWMIRLAASRRFQNWAARFPLTRHKVSAEGVAMFDLVAGFCHSQILRALIGFDIPARLLDTPADGPTLARLCDVPADRMEILLRAGVSLGLLRQRRGLYHLTVRGAALATVPGLPEMIRHHDILYRDLADPVGFFRDGQETELAAFWPYVFGAGAANDPATAATYSRLMADSQVLVAEDTLATVDLSGTARLMDVGGGTGAFLAAAALANPGLEGILFDLPAVAPAARARFDAAGLSGRVSIATGSFRDDALPTGADAISLVRVLYDHSDATVARLLAAVKAALPPGGRVIVSEPMTGGDRPERAGDAYFALYCLAMRTGRARSAERIAELLAAAGFDSIRRHRPVRPFITTVVTGVNQS
jgi:demethylspheroidene O-methyltransferase